MDDDDDEELEDEPSFSLSERNYMAEVLKQIISNGTTDQATCKTRKPFSIVPESDIDETTKSVFQLSGVFYAVIIGKIISYSFE